jgi:hypothetical protein
MGMLSKTLIKTLKGLLLTHQVRLELHLWKVRRNKSEVLRKFKGKKDFKVNVGWSESAYSVFNIDMNEIQTESLYFEAIK